MTLGPEHPLRVLAVSSMYPPQHLGGYELVMQGAVRALRTAGHEVTVLATDVHLREAPEQDAGVHRTLRWWWADHAFPRRSWRERLAVERHDAKVFDEHAAGADVVTWWAMGGMPLSLLSRPPVPSVAFVLDDWPVYGPIVDQRPFFVRVGRGTRAVGEWSFISQFTLRGALERRAIPAGARTRVVSPGIDTRFLDPAPAREWTWRLLFVGRIDERKGIDTAIEALALAPPHATLTIAAEGDESYADTLREHAAALGVSDRVAWVGVSTRDAPYALYDEHDAVLFPVRWYEPWGLVPLEAMGRGRPVVATGRGGSAEYLRDGVNTLLAPADDPPAFAAALERLARDPALRARLRAGGLATAREHTDERFHATVVAAVEAAAAGVTSSRTNRR